MQGHFIVGSTPSQADLTETLQAFAELVGEVAYTEIDIRHSRAPATADAL